MSTLKKTTRLAFALHSWLGLSSGIFLLLLGLSGSALVFMKEIDEKLHAAQLQVNPAGPALPLDQVYRQIASRHPNLAGIAWLNPDAAANRAWEFRLYQNDGRISTYDLGLISINPYTGAVIREGKLRDLNPSFMHWLIQFHWSFQLGIPGLLLATVFGMTMLLSMITGLIIYRKFVWRVLLFRVPIKGNNWRTRTSSLHRVIGVWTLLFNVIIFFTGFWMNMFAMDPGYWKKQLTIAPPNTLSTVSMDKLLSVAKAEMPGLMIRNIYLPTQPGKDFRASGMLHGELELFHNGNSVSLDPQSAKLTALQRFEDLGFWSKLESSFMPLHTGSFGNAALKMLYVLMGLMPGLMSITGALLFFRRRG